MQENVCEHEETKEYQDVRKWGNIMNDMILILDRSQEYGMELARRLRAEQIDAKIVHADTAAEEIRSFEPRGMILCGEASGELDGEILQLGIPVLAVGRAAYRLLACMGGANAGEAITEKKAHVVYGRSDLFTGVADGDRFFREAQTLMLPADVIETASAGGCTIAFEDTANKHYGVQFELERNDLEGAQILTNFVLDICGCSRTWTLDTALEQAQQMLAGAAAQGSHAICAISGGVDSTLCALLAHRAFGGKMTAIFIDTGLMREGEADDVQKTMEAFGIDMLRVDRSEEVLAALAGKHSMEDKREVVVAFMQAELLRRSAQIAGPKTLVLGTNYSDYLESGSGAPKWCGSGMTVVEPLTALFKDEIRAIGRMLEMGEELVGRKPFPALGLGARIVGEVTHARLEALRKAERIFRMEIEQAGMERKLYKYFPVFIGGERYGSEMIVLRAVTLSGGQLIPARLPYDLVERTVESILRELPEITRVFYDQTPTAIGQESFN